MRIEVEDCGPGVTEGETDRIFEKFYRSAGSSGVSQGTGLGLSIARGLVEAMNGSIAARNKAEAGGLIVTLTLPAHARG